ncbi:pilus assembly protein PilP [Eionea flava]
MEIFLQVIRFSAISLSVLSLASCSSKSNDDVYAFIEESKQRPVGDIRPLKRYPPYKPYDYSSQQMRSPFEPPSVIEQKIIKSNSNVKPDIDRQKQRLENFEFSSLSMVGTVKQSDTLWALIRDPEGSIERVKNGYYLGKNNGRIVNVNGDSIDVIEIVPNGSEGWLERPNILSMKAEE